MEWVEITGKSVEEAQELALEELGVDLSDAEMEVVAEPKTGLFGRLKGEARVRARVRPAVPRSKEDTNRRRRKPGKERADRSERPSSTDDSSAGETEVAPERTPRKRSNSRRPARRDQNEQSNAQGDPMEDVPLAGQVIVAEEFLAGFLKASGAVASIATSLDEDDELIFLNVDGESLGHLIGPRGATLHAVQDLTRTVVQRKTGARNGRIIVDISSYREKRRVALENFTRQVAAEVLNTGEARSLEPMSPPDRKVVHDTVNDIEGVSTTSDGEEPRRRVVIRPNS